MPQRSFTALLAAGLGLVILSAACSKSPTTDATPTASAVASASATAAPSDGPSPTASGPVVVGELNGRWKSQNLGFAYIRVEGADVKIVFEHNDGRVLGAFAGDTLTGWWTEAPGPGTGARSGDVHFTASRTATGLTLHGARRVGTSAPFSEAWDLVRIDDAIPTDVAAVLAGPASFVRHP